MPTETMQSETLKSTIRDPRVVAVIERMQAERRRPPTGGPRENPADSHNPFDYSDIGFSIHPEQGDLIYMLCRGMRATRVVEFATSVGMSTLYFAAAMRDNGGGKVIGSELVPAKVATAKRDLGGPVDFALIDGWPLDDEGPSLALQVIKMVAPQLRLGGYVMNDNAEPDFLDFIRDPQNGFLSVTLPLKKGTELSVKVA
jgi:hypothetical protein